MSKLGAKKITLISAIITLISFLYKLGLAYLTMSLVLLIASISTLMVFICKIIFVKSVTKTRDKKKKAYFLMMLSVLIYSSIFILFVVFKINGIDISNNKEYEGILGILFISFLILMVILSIIGLNKALNKTDIVVIGLKEMTFVSVMADLVIIEEFFSRLIPNYLDIIVLKYLHLYFPLLIGIIMIIVSISMLVRLIKYKK